MSAVILLLTVLAQADPEREAVTPVAAITADGVLVVGGEEPGANYLHNVLLGAQVDGRAVGWPGVTFYAALLGNHGGAPGRRVGDLQGTNNIEASDSWRLFEAWVQGIVAGERLSVLAGLYDLNSEFDVIGAAGLFIHSSFGIGAEFGLSGRAGPSIFPVTSLGIRLRALPSRAWAFQVAALDGVPGDRDHGGVVRIAFDEGDGLLLAAEAARYLAPSGRHREPQSVLRRRRLGRGRGDDSYGGKVAAGAWAYTGEFLHLSRRGPGGAPVAVRGSWGAYLLAEKLLLPAARPPWDGLVGFARVGAADSRVNPFTIYTGAGLVLLGPLSGRPHDEVGLGVAAAHAGEGLEEAREREGRATAAAEIALELTYRGQLGRVSVQPALQLVLDPAADPARRDAWIVGLRVEAGL